jgi:RNA-directed DNA polymerase
MMKKPTRRTLRRRAEALLACSTLEDVVRLLGVRAEKFVAMAANPQYREFTLPKEGGGRRLIEEPLPMLKRIQDYLGDFFQAVYYQNRSPAAFGFMVRPIDDPEPRHVLSNAQAHLGRPWLLNLDLKDFFHAVTTQRVREVLAAPLFGFPEDLCELLAGLCTYKGRLPMGAPSSPVLSNLSAIPLDEDLLALARQHGWTYTRYVDDMSFSSVRPITDEHLARIEYYVQVWGHELNHGKKKLYKPGDPSKEVTGLIVSGEKVSLPDDYLPSLEAAIDHLEKVIDAQHQSPSGRSQKTPWVENLRMGVHGKLEFARHVLGPDHFWVSRLMGKYYDAIKPPEKYGALSWLDFGYDWDFRSGW